MKPLIFRPVLTALIVLSLPLLNGCERVVPVRTLPDWVRGIYVPMVRNESTEPGIEELVTRMIQEEFLADGRLDVVKKRDADLELRATIEEWVVSVNSTDSDDIPDREEINIVTDLKLYDPIDPEEPVADLGKINTFWVYNADPRSVVYSPEPDRKRDALSVLARQTVAQTITGFPRELQDLPEDVELPDVQLPSEAFEGNVFRRRSEDFLD